MKKIVLKVDGMTCSACSSGLEKYLSKQNGVISANVNLVLSLVSILYENVSIKDLENYIKEAGFKSLGEFKGIEDNEINNSDKGKLVFFGILLLILMYVMASQMFNLPAIPFVNHSYPIILGTVLLVFAFLFLFLRLVLLKSGCKYFIH